MLVKKNSRPTPNSRYPTNNILDKGLIAEIEKSMLILEVTRQSTVRIIPNLKAYIHTTKLQMD